MERELGPLFEPVDPHLEECEKPRLTRQCREILELLRTGPATNTLLSEKAQRFGARIHDLRKHGYVISIIHRDRERGVTWYELEEEP